MFGDILGALSGGGMQKGYDQAAQQFRQQAAQYDPYVNRGNQSGDMLMGEYNNIFANPNARQDQIAQGFYQSPYQNHILNETTKRMNVNAANSGMLMSPTSQRALNDQINSMTGQFMNDYVNRGMQSYGMGMQGLQGQNTLGMNALQGQSDLISQGIGADLKASQAPLAAGNNFLGGLLGAGMTYATGGFGGGGLFGGAGAMSGPVRSSPLPGLGGNGMGYTNPYSSSWGF